MSEVPLYLANRATLSSVGHKSKYAGTKRSKLGIVSLFPWRTYEYTRNPPDYRSRPAEMAAPSLAPRSMGENARGVGHFSGGIRHVSGG